MKLDEFCTLAETFGGDVERWPEARRRAARELAHSPEAAAMFGRKHAGWTRFWTNALLSRRSAHVAQRMRC